MLDLGKIVNKTLVDLKFPCNLLHGISIQWDICFYLWPCKIFKKDLHLDCLFQRFVGTPHIGECSSSNQKGRKIRLSEKKPFRVLKMSHVFFPTMPGLCNNVQWKRWQILELSIALISWISFLNFWKNGKRRVTGELEICEIIQIGWKNSQVCSIWFYFGKIGGKNPKTCDCLVLIPWKQVWIHWLAEK